VLSVIGLLLALCAILAGAMLKGAGLMALVSTAGFTVVVLGTIGAICVQTPLPVMRHALKILPWVMRPPALQPEMLLKKMLDWSNTVRRQGLLARAGDSDHVRRARQRRNRCGQHNSYNGRAVLSAGLRRSPWL
jgi:flagellar motor component MotA